MVLKQIFPHFLFLKRKHMPWPFRKKKQPLRTPVVEPGARPEGVALPTMTNDRRYLKEVPYVLPKDLEEINRLDFQHYALRASLKSNHFLG